jgi:hypothetical protein
MLQPAAAFASSIVWAEAASSAVSAARAARSLVAVEAGAATATAAKRAEKMVEACILSDGSG